MNETVRNFVVFILIMAGAAVSLLDYTRYKKYKEVLQGKADVAALSAAISIKHNEDENSITTIDTLPDYVTEFFTLGDTEYKVSLVEGGDEVKATVSRPFKGLFYRNGKSSVDAFVKIKP